MKKLILFWFSSILLITNVYPQPFIGGEITWSCNSSGNYDFEFRYYRDCGGITYPQQLFLTTTVPGLNTIQMNLDTVIEITPVCNSAGPAIQCAGQNQQNAGTDEQWVYSSKTNYPNGVPLTGVPPPSGWVFSYSNCCRLPSSNVLNSGSNSFMYRAVMYAYNNQSTAVCFDNAPEFTEAPPSIINVGEQSWINYSASDKDNDSLSYEFDYALTSNGVNFPITIYTTGYSYSSPFPGSTTNPNNIPAYLNPETGILDFTSYERGAFMTVVKVTSYRDGQLISEIFRDYQIKLDTSGTNTSPDVSFPNATYEYFDTVTVGELVNFGVSATDFEFLPNGNPQTMFMEAFSDHFGANDTITTTGCPFPPCAVLNPPDITIGQFGVQKTVHWQTDCNHLNGNSTYDFIFKQKDDFCPIPSTSYAIARIVVEDYPELLPPEKLCISTLPNGDVDISWPSVVDSLNQFNGYLLYYYDTIQQDFTILDTISSFNQNSYVHQNALANISSNSYKIGALSGCSGERLAMSNEASSSIFLNAEQDTNSFFAIRLNWNPISSIGQAVYSIFANYFNGWMLYGTTTDTSFVDSTGMIYSAIMYKVVAIDTFGFDSAGLPFLCSATSNEVFFVGQQDHEMEGLVLYQNTPNPSSDITIIEFELPHAGNTNFHISNLLGQPIYKKLGHKSKGLHQIELDSKSLPAGVYFYSIEFENRRITKKMIIAH